MASALHWAEPSLLQRVFAIDVLQCPKCPGRMEVLAYLTDHQVVKRILEHLGLPSMPPPRGSPRARESIIEAEVTPTTDEQIDPPWREPIDPNYGELEQQLGNRSNLTPGLNVLGPRREATGLNSRSRAELSLPQGGEEWDEEEEGIERGEVAERGQGPPRRAGDPSRDETGE